MACVFLDQKKLVGFAIMLFIFYFFHLTHALSGYVHISTYISSFMTEDKQKYPIDDMLLICAIMVMYKYFGFVMIIVEK